MAKVTHWHEGGRPSAVELQRRMALEGLRPYRWENGPLTRYPVHVHGYAKVLYVVEGSISFGLPELGQQVDLAPGDRLDLPAGVAHDALVGPSGVICLEAQG